MLSPPRSKDVLVKNKRARTKRQAAKSLTGGPEGAPSIQQQHARPPEPGVSPNRKGGWIASITDPQKRIIHIGEFTEREDAAAAYKAKAAELYPPPPSPRVDPARHHQLLAESLTTKRPTVDWSPEQTVHYLMVGRPRKRPRSRNYVQLIQQVLRERLWSGDFPSKEQLSNKELLDIVRPIFKQDSRTKHLPIDPIKRPFVLKDGRQVQRTFDRLRKSILRAVGREK
jgi:hypothetical protein